MLLGGVALLGERRIALQIEPGVGEIGLVLGLLRLGLIERRLERPRIDLREQVARLDHLPFLEGDFHDLTVDARAHGHGVVSLHLTEAVEIDRIIGALDRSDRDENGRGSLAPAPGETGPRAAARNSAAYRARGARRRPAQEPIFPPSPAHTRYRPTPAATTAAATQNA